MPCFSVTQKISISAAIQIKRPEIPANSLLFSNRKNSGFWQQFQAKD